MHTRADGHAPKLQPHLLPTLLQLFTAKFGDEVQLVDFFSNDDDDLMTMLYIITAVHTSGARAHTVGMMYIQYVQVCCPTR